MQLKHWGARLALGVLLFAGALACRTADVFIAQATTVPTRTPRPTFTPLPLAIDTPQPTATLPATPKPTLRPTARPTARPPTAVPKPVAQPTAAPQPAKPSYQYSVANYRCEHSGGSWLKGHVYADQNDPNSAVPGVTAVFGGAGGEEYGTYQADGNGDFAFVLTPDGGGAKIGTFYMWISDGAGHRISDMAGPININGKPETAPDSCWAGWAFFVKNY